MFTGVTRWQVNSDWRRIFFEKSRYSHDAIYFLKLKVGVATTASD